MKLFLVLLFLLISYGNVRADQFVDDLSDKPGWNTGTNLLQAGVCAGVSLGIKIACDNEKRQDIDFMGLAMITVESLLIHSVYFREGGQNASDAIAETAFEIGGAALPIVFHF